MTSTNTKFVEHIARTVCESGEIAPDSEVGMLLRSAARLVSTSEQWTAVTRVAVQALVEVLTEGTVEVPHAQERLRAARRLDCITRQQERHEAFLRRKQAATPADFALPADLKGPGRLVAEAMTAFWRAEGTLDAGGCRVFYSPQEWMKRGEEYGRDSLLVVVHDGGMHAGSLSYDREQYARVEALNAALQPLGVFVEQCTGWYSAVYGV